MEIYEIIKSILTAICVICYLTGAYCLIRWIVMFLARNKDLKKRKNHAIALVICFVVGFAAMAVHFMVAVKQYSRPVEVSDLDVIAVSSESIAADGALNKETGAKHGNKSPQLTFDRGGDIPVYEIMMIDHDGGDWLHWDVYLPVGDKFASADDPKIIRMNQMIDASLLEITPEQVRIKEGAFETAMDGYVGPYPPSGTHTYTIYVFGLAGETRNGVAVLDQSGAKLEDVIQRLDDGLYTDYHNLKAWGKVEGTYSAD